MNKIHLKVKEFFKKLIELIKEIARNIKNAARMKIQRMAINKKLAVVKDAIDTNRLNPNTKIKRKRNQSDSGQLGENKIKNTKQVLKIYKNFINDYTKQIQKFANTNFKTAEDTYKARQNIEKNLKTKYKDLISDKDFGILEQSVIDTYKDFTDDYKRYEQNIDTMYQWQLKVATDALKEAEKILENAKKEKDNFELKEKREELVYGSNSITLAYRERYINRDKRRNIDKAIESAEKEVRIAQAKVREIQNLSSFSSAVYRKATNKMLTRILKVGAIIVGLIGTGTGIGYSASRIKNRSL